MENPFQRIPGEASKPRKEKRNMTGFEAWGGYMAAKKEKLNAQFELQKPNEMRAFDECSNIFNGISIYVNGYTTPSADELKRLMMLHGGKYHYHYSPAKTMYMIASNLPLSKIKALKDQRVVRPEWILDSIKARKVLPYQQYLLYNQEETFHQQTLFIKQEPCDDFSSSDFLSAESSSAASYIQSLMNPLPDPNSDMGLVLPHTEFRNRHTVVSPIAAPVPVAGPSMTAVDRRIVMPVTNQNRMTVPGMNVMSVPRQNMPVHSPNMMPVHSPNMMPVHSPNMMPVHSPNMMPVPSPNMMPVPSPNMMPVPSPNMMPVPSPNMMPVPSPNMMPVPSPNMMPVPSPNVMPVPSPNVMPVPSPNVMPVPSPNVMPVPSPNVMMVASPNMMTVPSPNIMAAPAPNMMATPAPNMMMVPGLNVMSVPGPNMRVPVPNLMQEDIKPDITPIAQLISGETAKTDFISEFYSHSRLHHLSSVAQDLKLYVQQLAIQQKGKPFSGRDILSTLKKPMNPPILSRNDKVVMHIDMDCFFVSVGLKKHPQLRGFPVAVAHSTGRNGKPQDGSNVEYEAPNFRKKQKIGSWYVADGSDIQEIPPMSCDLSELNFGSLSDVACCSYEAREFGLWNGMYVGEALRRCPQLKIIPYDFEAYNQATKVLYDTVASFTLDIEAVSCDELYVDCTDLLNDTKVAIADFVSILRHHIYVKTGCKASAGIGSNMLLARLASRVAKPNGQRIVLEDEIIEFMQDQKIKDLPGVGYSTRPKLEQMGIITCYDLQKWPISKLQKEFGIKKGQNLYEFCRGKDERVVTLEKDRKSVSAEINYGIRFKEEKEIYKFLNELAVEVHDRLKAIGKKGRSIVLKLKVRREDAPMETAKYMGHGVCDSLSKSTLLKTPTDDFKLIGNEVCQMARSLKIPPHDYRGVGIQVAKLECVGSSSHPGQTLDSFLSKTCFPNSEAVTSNPASDDVNFLFDQINDEPLFPATVINPPMAGARVVRNNPCLSVAPPPPVSLPMHPPDPPLMPAPPVMQAPPLIPVSPHIPAPYAGMTFDELDQSALSALPEELRQEVFSYTRAPVQSSKAPSAPVKRNTRPKAAAVGTGNVNAPKSKRNKPASLQSISNYCVKSKTSRSKSNSSLQASEMTVANLGGAVEIDDVRDLLKEWVKSTHRPKDEDFEDFKTYVLNLVGESLEKTDLVLKYFYRMAAGSTEMWRQSYLKILDLVQEKMVDDFGYMIKAKDSFT